MNFKLVVVMYTKVDMGVEVMVTAVPLEWCQYGKTFQRQGNPSQTPSLISIMSSQLCQVTQIRDVPVALSILTD